MTALRTYAAAALLATACTGPDAPPDVTTWADVQPVLASNCVRCHGHPASNGTPDTFRLDVFEDTLLDDRGDADPANDYVLRGAAAVSGQMLQRTDPEDAAQYGFTLMPPTVHLEDRQREILVNWFPAARGDRPGNTPPTIELLRPLEEVDGTVSVEYEIRDADHDMVRGQLLAGGTVIGELHSGRGVVTWDVGVLAPGRFELVAVLDDGGGLAGQQRPIGELVVDHANTAPTARIISPGPHALIHEDDPQPIVLEVIDADGGDLTLTVDAVRGDETRIGYSQMIAPGRYPIPWTDFADATEGGGWRLEISVSDGLETRRVTSATPFRISRAATAETAGSLTELIPGRCNDSGCHNAEFGLPGLTTLEGADTDPSLRGRMYRHVVVIADMPPPSGLPDYYLDPAERERLGDWLLGGAP